MAERGSKRWRRAGPRLCIPKGGVRWAGGQLSGSKRRQDLGGDNNQGHRHRSPPGPVCKAGCSAAVTHPEDTSTQELRGGGRGACSLQRQGAGGSGREARRAQLPRSPRGGGGAGAGRAFQDRRNVSVSKVKNARTRCALDLAPNSVLLVGE